MFTTTQIGPKNAEHHVLDSTLRARNSIVRKKFIFLAHKMDLIIVPKKGVCGPFRTVPLYIGISEGWNQIDFQVLPYVYTELLCLLDF